MSMMPHQPIVITSDSEFETLATTEDWPGNGSPVDPYLIENLQISTATVDYALYICDTTVSFVVSGCSIKGAWGSIYLQNVQNGHFDGNTLLGQNYAVILHESANNIISNNTCDTSSTAINLWSSDNIVLMNNTISSSLGAGIQIAGSINATVRTNTMTDCGMIIHPWTLEQSSTHTIDNDNNVRGKPLYYYSGEEGVAVASDAGQVILADCSNMTIENLTFTRGAVGVMLFFSSDIVIANVTSTDHSWCGVNIEYCCGIIIEDGDFSSNGNGIRIGDCEDTTVRRCTVSNNHMGIIVSMSEDTQLLNNICSGNNLGFFISSSSSCVLTSNTLDDNDITILGYHLDDWNTHSIDTSNSVNGKPVVYVRDQDGGDVPHDTGQLILANCSNLAIVGHTFDSDMETAVFTGFCTNVSFANCTFMNNANGIFMQRSSYNNLTNNDFLSSGLGIYTQYCLHNMFSGNDFLDGATGMLIDNDSNLNEILLNTFVDQSQYAIRVERQSTENTIHNNTFIGNNDATSTFNPSHVQSHDDSTNNYWSVNGFGNYWSDWTSPDNDEDGFVDHPYVIETGGIDDWPLVEPPCVPDYNYPPVASFTISPMIGSIGTVFTVDASSSNDADNPTMDLEVRWDWEDDGTWDTNLTTEKIAVHQYSLPGDYTVRLEAVDTGLLSDRTTVQIEVVVDDVNPSTSAQLSGVPGENGWYLSDVEAELEAYDEWSDIDRTQFRIDESDWQSYSAPFEISDDGIHTLEYFSEDGVGNAEDTQSTQVNIDCTAPVLDITTENGTVFDTDTINITLTCSDACSGVDCVEYSLDDGAYMICDSGTCIQLSNLGNGTHQLSVRIHDQAGNEATQELTFEVNLAADDDGEDEDTPTDTESYWLTAGAAIAVVAAVLIVTAFTMRRRGRAPPE